MDRSESNKTQDNVVYKATQKVES